MFRTETCTVAAKLLGLVIHSQAASSCPELPLIGTPVSLSLTSAPPVNFLSLTIAQRFGSVENNPEFLHQCSSLWRYQGLAFAPSDSMECCETLFKLNSTQFQNSFLQENTNKLEV